MENEILESRLMAIVKLCNLYHNGNVETEAWLKHIKRLALGEE